MSLEVLLGKGIRSAESEQPHKRNLCEPPSSPGDLPAPSSRVQHEQSLRLPSSSCAQKVCDPPPSLCASFPSHSPLTSPPSVEMAPCHGSSCAAICAQERPLWFGFSRGPRRHQFLLTPFFPERHSILFPVTLDVLLVVAACLCG